MQDPAPRIPDDSAPTAASAAIGALEPALSTSLRFHRPRGPICAAGHCAQCEIATAAGRMLACQAPVDTVAVRRHSLRSLGRIAERMPPWFYERHFLRPRALRRLWLHLLRHVSGAPALTAGERALSPSRRYVEREADVVVVGNGPGSPGAFEVRPDQGDVVVGLYPDRVLGVLRGGEFL